MTWDPSQYALFDSYRGRPFGDLLARVGASTPRRVVDLGCGDGPLTLGLTRRWPGARVIGVDSSPEMLKAARGHDAENAVEWVEARAQEWDPSTLGAPIDVLVTNATLQWVPTHLDLIPGWVSSLAPGGWFAMQVPTNFDAPSHALMREVAGRQARADELMPRLLRSKDVATPSTYLRTLADLGLETDVWETTYHHVLDPAGTQRSPVFEWVKGTGLRPVLEVLTDPQERSSFVDDYIAALDQAYPREAYGVVMGFSRLFAVGRRSD